MLDADEYDNYEQERAIIAAAQNGDAKAMEDLLKLHQSWVFNLVLRIVPDVCEAEDLSQEILLTACRKLASFEGKCRFRTWLYRIAVNKALRAKKSIRERDHHKFAKQWASDAEVNRYLKAEPTDVKSYSQVALLLAEEVMVKCMLGLLLCLNRKQRVVFALGDIMQVNGRTASEILGTTEEGFRKALSRARKRLYNFMEERCGLVNPEKPCRCERCAAVSYQEDPLPRAFGFKDAPELRAYLDDARARADRLGADELAELYRAHPMQDSPDFSRKVVELLNSPRMRRFLGAR